MPDPERSPTRLTVDRLSFEKHFVLEGPGYVIASGAFAAGDIQTPYEVVELICRANELYARMIFERMLMELEPSGKADDYVAALRVGDDERSAWIMFETLGPDRLVKITRELFRRLRDEFDVVNPAEERSGSDPAVLPVDQADFEAFFKIGPAGYAVAVEAFRQGLIGTPYEMVEMVCAANKSIARRIVDRLYAAASEAGSRKELESAPNSRVMYDWVTATLGEKRFDEMIREALIEVAEELHVSTTNTGQRENDKYILFSAAAGTAAN